MSLDPKYLEYPLRRRGMDHDRYTWSNIFERAPLRWRDEARVAVTIVVSLEWFPITAEDVPFRAPGHMQTSYPDYRHYTSRDYGSRVGIYRFLEAFAKHGVTAGVAMNSAIAGRYPQLVEDVLEGGHEIIAHATDMNATIASGMDKERHRDIIARAVSELAEATGTRPQGWLSIARSQAMDTPDLLAANQLRYMLDWVNDDLPYLFRTSKGSIVNLPLNHELSDRQVIMVHQQDMDSYVQQVEDAFDWLDSEAESHGGRMLPVHLTPYISALPYRIDALDELLGQLKAKGAWFAAPASLTEAYLNQVDKAS